MGSSHSTKIKVGITSLLAIFIMFIGILWVKEYNPMAKKNIITIAFNDAKGISGGDPVFLSGIKVGEVSNVDLDNNNKALVEIYVTKNILLQSDCLFTVKDIGLMGDKALFINPGASATKLDTTKMHEGTEGFDLSDLITNAGIVLQKLNRLSSKIDNDLDIIKLSQSFEQTFYKIQQAVDIYKEIANNNREPIKKSIESIGKASQEMQQFVRKNDENFENVLKSFEKTSEKISLTLDSIENISTVIDTLSTYMKENEGTLGKLVKSDELYKELRRTNASIDSFITDFRLNPGKYTKDMKFKVRLF